MVPIFLTQSVIARPRLSRGEAGEKSRILDFVPMPFGIEDSRYNSCELYRNTKSGENEYWLKRIGYL